MTERSHNIHFIGGGNNNLLKCLTDATMDDHKQQQTATQALYNRTERTNFVNESVSSTKYNTMFHFLRYSVAAVPTGITRSELCNEMCDPLNAHFIPNAIRDAVPNKKLSCRREAARCSFD